MSSRTRPATGLVWRLYAGHALVILVTLLVAGMPAARLVREDSLAELLESLERQALLVEEIVAPDLEALARSAPSADADARARRLQERAVRLGRSIETRITLITTDGTVRADSAEDPARMENHGDRPEILAAGRTRQAATSTRRSGTTGARLVYLAWPVQRGGELLGYVRISRSLAIVEARLDGARRAFLLGGLLSAVVALGLGFYLSRQLTRPLRSMTSVAEAIAAGDYDRRVRSSAGDEIGRLARAFDTMAQELGRRLETITTERNRMQAILRGMVEGVVAIDREERIVHVNRAAERILRAAPVAQEAAHIWELTRLEAVHRALGEAMGSKAKVSEELRDARSLGEQHIQMTASPLFDGRGNVVGAVLVLHDVTELRTLENIRRDFVANVSHELKTPLTAIRGMVETMLDDPDMEDAVRDRFLLRVHEQCLRLSTLVVDLLALSRLEAERGRELEEVDLRALARECGAEQQATAQAARIQLQVELPAQPVTVRGDREDLRQMLGNLIDNAIKYTPAGGRAGVRLLAEGQRARLEVWDTGIGIEPRDQERVFERFYRVDKARSRELGGTGLGLAIVKHVVLKHRGELSVESAAGQGSTFAVLLPVVVTPGEA